jgi:hypothetical protein
MADGSGSLPATVTAAALRAAARTPAVPFRIAMAAGDVLTVTRLLRVLPGRRLVGQAHYAGRSVLAKLFVSTDSARYWNRERSGIHTLLAAGIATPALIAAEPLADGGHVLLTEFLPGAATLAEAPPEGADAATLLAGAARLLGSMHRSGVLQTDLHLGNLLAHQGRLYMIDGDGIRRRRVLGERAASRNLATLLALLPPQLATHGALMLGAYREANPALRTTPKQIDAACALIRARRLRAQLRKCFRECSRFRVEQTCERYTVVLREAADWLAPVIADPGRWHRQGSVAADGHARTIVSGHPVCIRAYRGPDGLSVSAPWRLGPASAAWRAANQCWLEGRPAALPLALIETRHGFRRGPGWVILAEPAAP